MGAWKFNVWRLPIYICPPAFVVIEWGLRSISNKIDAIVFIGPTLAVAGVTIILPLLPPRPYSISVKNLSRVSISAEKLLTDPNVYNKFMSLQQDMVALEDQGLIEGNTTQRDENEDSFIGTCVVCIIIFTVFWFMSIYLELTSTNTNFIKNVIWSFVLGLVSFGIGIALSEAREKIS